MLNRLLEECGATPTGGQYTARARYSSAMDSIDYLADDCAYRSDRVDGWLTLFWHPVEERLVGLRVKGMRHIFVRASLAVETGVSEESFASVIGILRLIVEAWGEHLTQSRQLVERYRLASDFAKNLDLILPAEDVSMIREQAKAA
jgi:hypothetical protein